MLLLLWTLAGPAHADLAPCSIERRLWARAEVAGDAARAHLAREALALCLDDGSLELPEAAPASDLDATCVAAAREAAAHLPSDLGPWLAPLTRCGVTRATAPQAAAPLSLARLTSGFGMRLHPILKKPRLHTGLDLDARDGELVGALQAGVVVFAGQRGGYGHAVVVEHPAGLRTLYAHNRALLVTSGQLVSRGQGLAEAGRTGLATGVHVHLEVRRDDRPVDPTPYLRDPARLL